MRSSVWYIDNRAASRAWFTPILLARYRWWIITARSNVGDCAHDRSEKNSSCCYPPGGTVSVSNRSDMPCLYSTIFFPKRSPEVRISLFYHFFFLSGTYVRRKQHLMKSLRISRGIPDNNYLSKFSKSTSCHFASRRSHSFNINSPNSTRLIMSDRSWLGVQIILPRFICPVTRFLILSREYLVIESCLSLRHFSREGATTIVNVTVSHTLFTLQHLYIYIFMYVYYRL